VWVLVGLLFEICIVDASIYSTRIGWAAPLGVGLVVWCCESNSASVDRDVLKDVLKDVGVWVRLSL
jgi:hypothetical protein